MDAIEPNIHALVIFAVAWLICCAGALKLSGHLPLSAMPDAVRSRGGTLLIFLNAALLAFLFALTVIFSHHELRWPAVVVVGGLIFLFSPFAIQDLPDALKNGKAGLLLLFVLLLAALGLLLENGAKNAIINIFS